MFSGSLVALVTPMAGGTIDEKAFQAVVDWQISEGTNGLVPCGTTGESATMTDAEHARAADICIEVAAGRVPVIIGAGSSSTAVCIHHAKHAEKSGADAVMVVVPPYNKPSQEGLFRHFKAIHDAIGLPILMYNVPGRTVTDLSVDTVARLARLERIIGIKDATGDLERPIKTRLVTEPDFCQLSGEDATAIPFNAAGGVGCISVSANVVPRLCADMQRAWANGDLATAQNLQERLLALHSAMFCEASPGPAKYGLSLLGRCGTELRLPLCEISERAQMQVRDAMAGLGLLVDRAAE
jgi:4-hydroxy-tetrahydrodipicolinate synthase